MRRPRMSRSASTRGTQSGTSPRSSAQTSMSVVSRIMARRSRPRLSQTLSSPSAARARGRAALPSRRREAVEGRGRSSYQEGRNHRGPPEQRAVGVHGRRDSLTPAARPARGSPSSLSSAGFRLYSSSLPIRSRYSSAPAAASAPRATGDGPTDVRHRQPSDPAASKPVSASSDREMGTAGENRPSRPRSPLAGMAQMRKNPSTWSMRNAWKNLAACASLPFHHP